MEDIIHWKDKELIHLDPKASHASGGRLEKYWVMDKKSGKQYLIKGSLPFCYEPICEKLAYLIGSRLGLDVLEYDIIPISEVNGMLKLNPLCKYVSICEKLDVRGLNMTSVAEIKRAINLAHKDEIDKGASEVKNFMVMYELLPRKYVDSMILFDAIIGNRDRHYGNVHILRDLDGNITGAPLLDNGDSLLSSWTTFEILLHWNNLVKKADESSCLEKTHFEEVKLIKSLYGYDINIPVFTINVLMDLEPTLKLLGPIRREAIRKYLVGRIHYFLGLIKRAKADINFKEIDGETKEIEYSKAYKREKEHT